VELAHYYLMEFHGNSFHCLQVPDRCYSVIQCVRIQFEKITVGRSGLNVNKNYTFEILSLRSIYGNK
jgi:hypothetical protein